MSIFCFLLATGFKFKGEHFYLIRVLHKTLHQFVPPQVPLEVPPSVTDVELQPGAVLGGERALENLFLISDGLQPNSKRNLRAMASSLGSMASNLFAVFLGTP